MSELPLRRLLLGCALFALSLALLPSASAPTQGAEHGSKDDIYLEAIRWMKERWRESK